MQRTAYYFIRVYLASDQAIEMLGKEFTMREVYNASQPAHHCLLTGVEETKGD